MYIGHNRERELFKNLINNKRLSHSYILFGQEGIGKQLFAENIARAVNCENQTFFEECSCKNCRLAMEGTHPDIHILDKGQIKIENIRNIISQTESTPFLGRYKVFILDGAEQLSASKQVAAANALLKTLEEPSGNTLFLLVTSNLDIMLPTIKSRSNIIKFSHLSKDELAIILKQNEESAWVNDNSYERKEFSDELLTYANGSIKRALLFYEMDINLLSSFLARRAWKDLTIYILAIKNDKDRLSTLLEWLYLEAFRRNKLMLNSNNMQNAESYSIFANYIMEIFQKLNYNINIDLLECDIISHIMSTFEN